MFSAHTEKLRREVEGLVKVVTKHEQIRSIVWSSTSSPNGRPDPLEIIKRDAPEPVLWKIYDHSAGYTRLYALFERFVFDVVDEWLIILPELYTIYSQLPEQVRNCHRVGVGQILTKLGGDQYQHLSEEAILKGISEGVVEKGKYSFLPDAFYTEGQNLWPGVLESLFRKIGIGSVWCWVVKHRAVSAFLSDFRGNASSAESELQNLVHYRNLAAHGDIGEVVSVDDFSKVAMFVIAISESLAQLIMWNVIKRRQAMGQVELIGQAICTFGSKIVGVNASGSTVAVDDNIIVMRDNACHYTAIMSIQENHVGFSAMTTQPDQQIALKLTHQVKTGSQLFRLLKSPNPIFIGQGI